MTYDVDKKPINEVRHPGQAVHDEAWIKALLHRAPVGALATDHDGQPFINTNLFIYDEPGHAIWLHTAPMGRTRFNVENEARVCFSVMEMGRLLPHAEALQFSVEYSGVVVFGKARIINELDASRWFFQVLFAKYAPHRKWGVDFSPPPDGELMRPTVYRIAIDLWSGKREVAADDYPGAFVYGSSQ